MSEQWGKWQQHDGKGCPCVGEYVQCERVVLRIVEVIAGAECISHGLDPNGAESAWVWREYPKCGDIIRYRIRKPKGLTLLEEIAKNPERELEDV